MGALDHSRRRYGLLAKVVVHDLRCDRQGSLTLFGLSHAAVSERDVTTGTRGRLDPLPATPQRPDFDHAERYAAAVTPRSS